MEDDTQRVADVPENENCIKKRTQWCTKGTSITVLVFFSAARLNTLVHTYDFLWM